MLTGLCELEAEIRRSLTLSHEVSHTRLVWWGEECERTAKGEARHPLTQALAREVPPPQLAGLPGLVDTAMWDLASATFETRREVTAYCERWAAALFEPAARHAQIGHDQAGYDKAGHDQMGKALIDHGQGAAVSPAASPHWLALGGAVREIELLAHLRDEAQAGRLRLPLDELERAGVAPEALSQTPFPAPLAALLTQRHQELRRTLAATVLDLAPGVQPATRGILVWVQLAWRLSRQAQRALPRELPPQGSGGVSAGWAAWRAARAAQRGTYRLQYRA